MWYKLLAGKSARVVYTQDAPFVFSYIATRDCFWNMLNKGVLQFCGFSPIKRTVVDRVRYMTDGRIERIFGKVFELGRKGK